MVTKDMNADIRGRHVLLVDTIIDTGMTMHSLLVTFSGRMPATLRVTVLLDKKCRRIVEVPVAYRGFEIPDEFVAGYGMDFREEYRNLPAVAVLDADA
jgi:hypoxanthine phosphoribosyltransferase